jgi:tetratricopeptide (TPR) repeat protein
MSLKRRMKRALERRADRVGVAFVEGYEITYKPIHPAWFSRLPASAREAIGRLNPAVREGEPDDAMIRELEGLVEAYPFAPVFYNYLTIAYSHRGMHERADQTIDKVLQRIPDYLFARLNRAEHLIRAGNDEEFRTLLGPSLKLRDLYPGRKRFHVSEFAGFYGVVGLYELQRGNRGRAVEILNLLDEVAPEENATRILAGEMERPRFLDRLARFVRTMDRPRDGAK